MTTQSNGVSSGEENPRKLKILMLHGYTQSGPLFHAKTRALEKALHKAFPPSPTPSSSSTSSSSTTSKSRPRPPGTLPSHPGGVQLIYPSGPLKLRAADIPGSTTSTASRETDANANADDSPDTRGWWRRNDRTGDYEGIEDAFRTIADAIREVGGVDGVLGFSQGGAAAPMVASLLEPERPAAFAAAGAGAAVAAGAAQGDHSRKGGGMAYPTSFTELRKEQAPLKFAIAYSAFLAPSPSYKAFYEPKISTPVLHVVGTLDTVVEESRSLALVDACVEPKVAYHPGGHFVPIGKEMVGVLVGFIRQCCEDDLEESVEDLEVPF